ncbi:hypothetical protein WA158_007031 [Blastocystis sp. Blastoise]
MEIENNVETAPGMEEDIPAQQPASIPLPPVNATQQQLPMPPMTNMLPPQLPTGAPAPLQMPYQQPMVMGAPMMPPQQGVAPMVPIPGVNPMAPIPGVNPMIPVAPVNPIVAAVPQIETQNTESEPLVIPEDAKHTLYIKNIKMSVKPQSLRKALYGVFIQFGKILNITVGEQRFAYKGQAWIVFENIEDAVRAKNKMSGVELYKRSMIISFAKMESDFITKKDGTYIPRPKKPYVHPLGNSKDNHGNNEEGEDNEEMGQVPLVKQVTPQVKLPNNPPNKLLMCVDLPAMATEEYMTQLFSKFDGFISARYVISRGLCFLDFQSIADSMKALEEMKGYTFDGKTRLHITFAK